MWSTSGMRVSPAGRVAGGAAARGMRISPDRGSLCAALAFLLVTYAARRFGPAYVMRRLAVLAATLAAASAVVFVVVQMVPGDPARYMMGLQAEPGAVAALRHQLGLDSPAPQRYLDWLGGLVHGDFGTSYTYRVPVGALIARAPAGFGAARCVCTGAGGSRGHPHRHGGRRPPRPGGGPGPHRRRPARPGGAEFLAGDDPGVDFRDQSALGVCGRICGLAGRMGVRARLPHPAGRGAGDAAGGDTGPGSARQPARHLARRLCAHGARQGRRGMADPLASCAAQRAHPGDDHPGDAVLLPARRRRDHRKRVLSAGSRGGSCSRPSCSGISWWCRAWWCSWHSRSCWCPSWWICPTC